MSLVFASGVAINKLSDAVSISAALVIALALVTLLVMINYERSGEKRPADRIERKSMLNLDSNLALIELSLSALLLGASVGGISVIPLLKSWHVDWPPGATYHSYEVGAFVVLQALTIVGALRARSLSLSLSFVLSAVAGMSLAIVFLKPGNDFTATFLGWSLLGLVLTFVVLQAGRMFFQLRSFLLGSPEERGSARLRGS